MIRREGREVKVVAGRGGSTGKNSAQGRKDFTRRAFAESSAFLWVKVNLGDRIIDPMSQGS
jgi:hypothetical protein